MANRNNISSLSPIIITGGCGFIGFHLASGLLKIEPNCQIHVIDTNVSRNRVNGVEYHRCDITSPTHLDEVFTKAKPKTIFHVACPDSMVHQDAIFKRVNVDGAHNLLVAARNIGTVQAFVNTSTSSVIHDNVSDLIDADENLPVLEYPAQKRVYTLTKAEAEAEILASNRANGDSSMLTVSMRPATTFGQRDTICMGKIVANCRAGKGRFQIGPGQNTYSVVYVSNLVDVHILAAQALVRAYGKPPPPPENRVDGQSFNITNDETVLFWDFQRAISASVGLPIKQEDIKVIPVWVALLTAGINEWATWITTWGKEQPIVTREAVRLTTIHRTLNCEKAKRVLGYKPKITIQEGIEIASKWFVEGEGRA